MSLEIALLSKESRLKTIQSNDQPTVGPWTCCTFLETSSHAPTASAVGLNLVWSKMSVFTLPILVKGCSAYSKPTEMTHPCMFWEKLQMAQSQHLQLPYPQLCSKSAQKALHSREASAYWDAACLSPVSHLCLIFLKNTVSQNRRDVLSRTIASLQSEFHSRLL